jgi:hypothetical protein
MLNHWNQYVNPPIHAIGRKIRLLAALMVLGLAGIEVGYAEERVNLQPSPRELKKVESCSGGGTLRFAGDPAYKGLPWHLVETVPDVREQHVAVTRGEDSWVKAMGGPADYVRLFERDGQSALVWDVCKPHECHEYALYAAFDLGSKAYSIEITEKGKRRQIGTSTPITKAAIACARASDEKKKVRQ